MPQCKAKSKRSQEQCRRRASRGHAVCCMHGARTPRGFGLPQTKTGKYSKVLPVRLAQRYEEAKANQRLLSLRDDLAVCESRLADLFTRVDTGESGALWQALRAALDQFSTAQARVEVDAMDRHFATIRQLVTQGSDDYAAWAEIYRVWEARGKLTQQEARTLMTMQSMVTTEQLMTMMGTITDVIQRHVMHHADPTAARAILGAISQEFHLIAVREAEA